jgi:hypothetical protein
MRQRKASDDRTDSRGFGLTLAIYALAQFSPAFISSALACACCTNEGQRNVATVALDSGKRQEIESLRFAGKATIFTGEGDVDGIEGIATPAGTYKLAAKWVDDQLVLSFRDLSGHTGTLSLARPGTMSVFEVDPARPPRQGSWTSALQGMETVRAGRRRRRVCPGHRPAPDPDADPAGQRQFLHLRNRLFALDAGDAGPESQLHPVRRPGAVKRVS